MWVQEFDVASDSSYYRHLRTHQTQWEVPETAFWASVWDEQHGATYYQHSVTGETRWSIEEQVRSVRARPRGANEGGRRSGKILHALPPALWRRGPAATLGGVSALRMRTPPPTLITRELYTPS